MATNRDYFSPPLPVRAAKSCGERWNFTGEKFSDRRPEKKFWGGGEKIWGEKMSWLKAGVNMLRGGEENWEVGVKKRLWHKITNQGKTHKLHHFFFAAAHIWLSPYLFFICSNIINILWRIITFHLTHWQHTNTYNLFTKNNTKTVLKLI